MRPTRRSLPVPAVLAVLAVLVAAWACGEGHAIFDVDVFSFIQGSGGDTLHYTIPPGIGGTVQNPPLSVTLLPGLGSSVVDTVQLTGAAAAQNKTGGGQIGFNLYFAADSDSVYAASNTPILSTPLQNVGPGVDTVSLPLTGAFTSAQDSLFTQKKVYVGVQLQLTNTGATVLDGRLQLTALHLRLVIKDKIF